MDNNLIIQQFYLAYYGRPADPEGIAFWLDAMTQAAETTELIGSFGAASQPEFASLYGEAVSIEEFFDRAYFNILRRPSDEAGRDFWIGIYNTMIADGISADDARAALLIEFVGGIAGGSARDQRVWETQLEIAQETTQLAEALSDPDQRNSLIALVRDDVLGNLDFEDQDALANGLAAVQVARTDVIEGPAATLTMAEAFAILDNLPERYILDPSEPFDAGPLTIEQALSSGSSPAVTVFFGALNADQLVFEDIVRWYILDTANAILGAIADEIPYSVSAALSVQLTDTEITQSTFDALAALDNFQLGDVEVVPDENTEPLVTLTILDAILMSGEGTLPARYEIDPDQPFLLPDPAEVQFIIDGTPGTQALIDGAENAAELAGSVLILWHIVDSAEAILAALAGDSPSAVTAALSVQLTDTEITQSTFDALAALDNFQLGDVEVVPDEIITGMSGLILRDYPNAADDFNSPLAFVDTESFTESWQPAPEPEILGIIGAPTHQFADEGPLIG